MEGDPAEGAVVEVGHAPAKAVGDGAHEGEFGLLLRRQLTHSNSSQAPRVTAGSYGLASSDAGWLVRGIRRVRGTPTGDGPFIPGHGAEPMVRSPPGWNCKSGHQWTLSPISTQSAVRPRRGGVPAPGHATAGTVRRPPDRTAAIAPGDPGHGAVPATAQAGPYGIARGLPWRGMGEFAHATSAPFHTGAYDQ
ncbi:hypothetical protein GCM10010106_12840 [Thermopolyspora flexuosa]|nr:hypothetical protein GCM10010106_12840 [Thermopolyspora flexuosa]